MVKVLFFRFRVTNSMGALLFSHIRVTSMKLINEKNLLNYCSFKMTWPASFCYFFCIWLALFKSIFDIYLSMQDFNGL